MQHWLAHHAILLPERVPIIFTIEVMVKADSGPDQLQDI